MLNNTAIRFWIYECTENLYKSRSITRADASNRIGKKIASNRYKSNGLEEVITIFSFENERVRCNIRS